MKNNNEQLNLTNLNYFQSIIVNDTISMLKEGGVNVDFEIDEYKIKKWEKAFELYMQMLESSVLENNWYNTNYNTIQENIRVIIELIGIDTNKNYFVDLYNSKFNPQSLSDHYIEARHSGEYKNTIKNLKTKLENPNLTNDEKAEIYYYLGCSFMDLENNHILQENYEAKKYFSKALDLAENIDYKAALLFEISRLVDTDEQLKYIIESINLLLEQDKEPKFELQSLAIYYQKKNDFDMADEVVDEMVNSALTRNADYEYCFALLERVNNLLLRGDKRGSLDLSMDIVIKKYQIGAKDKIHINLSMIQKILMLDGWLLDEPNIALKFNIVKNIYNEITK